MKSYMIVKMERKKTNHKQEAEHESIIVFEM